MAEDRNRINTLIKKAGSVIGLTPDTVETIAEQRSRGKIWSVFSWVVHSLHSIFTKLLLSKCSTERIRMYFVPVAIRLFNEQC